jgi:hypothetical protein
MCLGQSTDPYSDDGTQIRISEELHHEKQILLTLWWGLVPEHWHDYNSISLLRTLAIKSIWHIQRSWDVEASKNNTHMCASFTITEVWFWRVPVYNPLSITSINSFFFPFNHYDWSHGLRSSNCLQFPVSLCGRVAWMLDLHPLSKICSIFFDPLKGTLVGVNIYWAKVDRNRPGRPVDI